jgi:hypothetical protein
LNDAYTIALIVFVFSEFIAFMRRNNWEIPNPVTWTSWCTYDWDEADDSTKMAFNCYCNALLPRVNRKWNDKATRLEHDMIDVCTPSDEVYVIKLVEESLSHWVEMIDKKTAGATESVQEDAETRGGNRVLTTDEEIKALNLVTNQIISRRKCGYAKQWCKKVRDAKYDVHRLLYKFLDHKNMLLGNEIHACALENGSKSGTTEELLIILPDDDDI